MIETELDQISLIKSRFKLYSSFPNNNFNLYTVSDIPPDETIQDISLNENKIESAVLD